MTDSDLVRIATELVGSFRVSETCSAAGVASALVTRGGNVYTGICIDTECSLGFCAEHAAVAEMLKAREAEILTIVAVSDEGGIVPPCGRCRELLWQIGSEGADIRVIVGPSEVTTLAELLPQPRARRRVDP
jgi:cytidine deaminase